MNSPCHPLPLSLSQLLATQVARTPEAVALVAPGRTPLTYTRLQEHMNEVVETLNALGVGRNDRIALILPNGPEMAVAFLTVAAGATSAPLNPAYRASEFDFYLADLNTKALIVQAGEESPARAIAEARGLPIFELTPQRNDAAGLFTLDGSAKLRPTCGGVSQPDEVALVLPTSGTTSRPKIVPLTHANISISANNIRTTLALSADDRCLNIMPLFHIHGLIGALLSSLAAGASVVCTPGFYAPKFFAWLEEFRPTWYTAVPTMHQAILGRARTHHDLATRRPLRFIRSSSAALPSQVLVELESVFQVPVIESYGMTEAAHQMASNPLPPCKRKAGSVGPAAGPAIAIIDETDHLLSAGETGEVVIRGENVTSGYENNERANATAFTQGWFRTGDQGYLDSEGYLFLTARLKELINRGGEKIAPREVDEVLLEHPAVAQAVTFAMPHRTLGEQVAAAVVLQNNARVTPRELRAFVAQRLADFKVPHHIVLVEEIPKGPTGKLQRIGVAERLGLTTVEHQQPQEQVAFAAPQTPVEKVLAQIWLEVLGLEGVGCQDNFFHLGGDSILATQVLSRIRTTLQAEVSVIEFFEAPTIAGLAQHLAQEGRTRKTASPLLPLRPTPRYHSIPLSYTQQALWFFAQLVPGGARHNRPAALRLTGPLHVAALTQSLRELVDRHESLRTIFTATDGQPAQVICPSLSVPLSLVDLRTIPVTTREARAVQLAFEEAQQSFDLARGPLLRTALLRLHEDEHVLLVTMHHMISDGWSSEVFFRELAVLYNALTSGNPAVLPPLSVQYADFTLWQRDWLQGEVLERLLAYWKQQLRGQLPILELPTDHPRLERGIERGVHQSRLLPKVLGTALKSLSGEEEATLFMTLLTAFKILLYRYTGQEDILVGVPTAGRNRKELEGVIGYFSNMLVLRSDLSGNPNFRTLLSRVREMALGAYACQDLPLAKLIEEWRPERHPSLAPLFQVTFNLRNVPQTDWKFSDLQSASFAVESGIALSALSLEVIEKPDGLLCIFEYDSSLFNADTIARMLDHFRTLLEGIVSHPTTRLTDFPLWRPAQRQPAAGGITTTEQIPMQDRFAAQPTAASVAPSLEPTEVEQGSLRTPLPHALVEEHKKAQEESSPAQAPPLVRIAREAYRQSGPSFCNHSTSKAEEPKK